MTYLNDHEATRLISLLNNKSDQDSDVRAAWDAILRTAFHPQYGFRLIPEDHALFNIVAHTVHLRGKLLIINCKNVQHQIDENVWGRARTELTYLLQVAYRGKFRRRAKCPGDLYGAVAIGQYVEFFKFIAAEQELQVWPPFSNRWDIIRDSETIQFTLDWVLECHQGESR